MVEKYFLIVLNMESGQIPAPLLSFLENEQWWKVGLGIFLLFLGRKLFGVWVALVGFLVGFRYSFQFAWQHTETWPSIPILAGSVTALFALLLKKIAIVFLGFIGGGYVAAELIEETHTITPDSLWFFFLMGGVAGAILITLFLDWTIIIFSVIAGTLLIVDNSTVSPFTNQILIFVLPLLGISIQAVLLEKGKNL